MSDHRFSHARHRIALAGLSIAAVSGQPLAADVIGFTNIATYSSYSNPSGPVLPYLSDFVTPMQMDDLVVTPGAGGQLVTGVTFGAANSNTTGGNLTAFALVRFYKDDGPNGGPGTLISSLAGVTGGIAPKAYGLFGFNIPAAQQFALPLNGKVWAGVAFASGNGSNVTPAQLANFGVPCFNPPVTGTSTTSYYVSSDGGSYSTNNPSGVFKTATAAKANFAWEVKVAALGPVNVTSTADTSDPGTLRYANAATTATIPIAFRLPSYPATISLSSALALQVNPTVLQLPTGSDVTLASPISTARVLSINGPGILRLTGVNTYSGGTTLNSGAFVGIGNLKGLGTGDLTAAASSRLFATAAAQAPANDIVLSSGATLGIADAPSSPQALTLAGIASGSGALEMTGTNLLTLAGTNTFTGGLKLTAGTVAVSTAGNLGGATNPVTFNGGTLRVTGTGLTSFGGRPVNGSTFNGTLEIADAGNTFAAGSALSGPGSLTKTGAGRLVLTGTNALTGGVNVAAGDLAFSGTGAGLGSTTPLTVTGGNVVIPPGGPFTIGALNGSTGGTVRNDSVAGGAPELTFSLGNGGATASYAGTISDVIGNAPLALEKMGSGTQTLAGNADYSGATRVKQGTLVVSSTRLLNTSSVTVDAGATLTLSSGTVGSGTNAPLLTVNGTLQGSGTLRGPVVNNGTIRPTQSGVIDASSVSSFVNNGTIDLTAGNVLLPANFTNGPSGVVITPGGVPQIKDITRNDNDGTVTVRIDGTTGHTYRLQKSATLDAGSFTDTAAPAQTGMTGTTLSFTDTPTESTAFYRIRID